MSQRARRRGIAIGVFLAIVAGGVLYSCLGRVATGGTHTGVESAADATRESASSGEAVAAELVANTPETIRVDRAASSSLEIRTSEVRPATKSRVLELQGSLALDTNRLVRVHSRFAGEVLEVVEIPDEGAPRPEGRTPLRPIGFGDTVHKGQLLAVVWSKDLGEKKSELADALSQLRFDQEQLGKMSEAARDGAISEAKVRLQQRNVEADLTAVARAERTLRVWRLSESEIEAVKEESQRIHDRRGKRDVEKEKDWARVEVAAPFDGVVMEKNITLGDIIDTTADLFKIANVDSLTVWANAYEENLPALLDLPPSKLCWSVRVNAEPGKPPLLGRIDKVGYVSDPAQHTVMVMGRVDNPGGRLRAGQFVTAVIDLPPSPNEAVVPASAVVEDGHESVVFVQPSAASPCYSLRRVAVTWRSPQEVHVRSLLKPEELARGLRPLAAGQRVVSNSAIELKSALDGLLAAGKGGT